MIAAASVNAQLLFKEEFNYPTGNLVGQGAWTAFSASGVQPVKVVEGGLSLTGYNLINSDGKAIKLVPTGTGAEDVESVFTTSASTGNVYVSYLLKIDKTTLGTTASPAEFMSLNSTGSINRAKLAAVEDSEECYKFVLGWNNFTSGHKVSGRTFDYGTTYLVVMKYEIVSGADNDKVSLYVFDSTTPMPATEPSSPEIANVGGAGDMNPVGKIRFNQLGGSSYPQDITIDGVAAVQSWANFFDPTLPVMRRSFKSEPSSGGIKLNWSTNSEKDNSLFRILRMNQQNEFNEIGTVKGNGSINRIAEYSFLDPLPLNGNNYYRIDQVDHNGTVNEFGTLVANFNPLQKESLSVFSTPASVEVNVTAPDLVKNATINVFNASGEQLYTLKKVQLQQGGNQLTLPLILTTGLYVLNIEGQGLSLKTKFLGAVN